MSGGRGRKGRGCRTWVSTRATTRATTRAMGGGGRAGIGVHIVWTKDSP